MVHPREIEILNILFGTEAELTSRDIIKSSNSLSQSTVQAVLRKLLAEGLVTVEGTTHSRNVLSRTYRPTGSAKEAIKQQFIDSYLAISNIIPADELIEELKKPR